MSTHKYIDKICWVAVVLALIIGVLAMNAQKLGIQEAQTVKGYEARLFDASTVHTIDIVMDDWDDFIENCTDEEYVQCSVIIDNEAWKNVAIRAKGNTSLSQVASYGNDRYSFKIEFDHYDSNRSYYGLDKLSLNNIIQDNTYMKDFITYQLMQQFDVDAPLCSYAYITVNGQDWGLYLAVESVEESFLERNYGSDYGNLYKPDSMSMGGGRGNGNQFNMDDWNAQLDEESRAQIQEALEQLDESTQAQLLEKLGYSSLEELISALDEADQLEDVLNGTDLNTLLNPDQQDMPQMPGQMTQEMPGMTNSPAQEPANMQPGENDMQPAQGEAAPDMAENASGLDQGNMPQPAQDNGMPFGSGDTPSMQTPAQMPDQESAPDQNAQPGFQHENQPGGMGDFGGGMGSDDVKLIYSDDSFDSYSNIFENAKTEITDADKERLIASLKQLGAQENLEEVVNIEEVIRYFVVHNFVCNFDSYTGSMIHNYYLYEEDGQFSMIPWDYNLAFGGFQNSGEATSLVNYPIDSPVSSGTIDSRPMLAWIFSDEEYTQLYHQYFSEFIDTCFTSGEFADLIDSTQELIAGYVEKDPTKFCTYDEFITGVSTLKEFCLLRAQSVAGQLEGTIPATSDAQNQDSSSLIDASYLTISDMGSMNNGMGGMDQPGGQPDFQSPQTAGENSGENVQENPSFSNGDSGEEINEAPGFGKEQDPMASPGQTPDQIPGTDSNADSSRPSPGADQQNFPENFKQGENNPAPGKTAVSGAGWGLLALSVLALALGIAIAGFYRKRA